MKERTWHFISATLGLLITAAPAAFAHHSIELKEEIGKDIVYLDVPAEGVVANQSANFSVHVVKDLGPTGGEEPEICQTLQVTITMPEMPGMPVMVPVLQPMGDPGLMLFSASFPHGGDYRITVTGNNGSPFETYFDERVQDPNTAAGAIANNPYSLKVETSPGMPSAGAPVQMTLHILDNSTGKPVTEFDVVHEKKMHLFIVRSDLSRFFHVHPTPNDDGSFTYSFIFPTGGDWRLFADTAPHNFGSRITMFKMAVNGLSDQDVPLPAASSFVSTVDGMTLTLTPGPLEAHDTRDLDFILRDSTGKPVTDIQPWLGADAHLMLIDSSASLFVHSHPADRSPSEISAGKLTFVTHLPQSGEYKAWLQLQRGGQIHTFVFLISVA